jgi:LysR family transcriptional regulator, glycine cleavage system transcriptional activator
MPTFDPKKMTTTPPARRALPPFEALRAFDAVARLGGVRKAAIALQRNHAVVSRHLRNLEDWTGTTLIKRTAGGSVLTKEGVTYHQDVGLAIDDIARATMDLMKRGDNNNIEIWCMPGFATQWLMERLASYERSNPDISVALRSTEETPDFNLYEADIDIRYDPAYGESFQTTNVIRSVKLATPTIIPVASPDYLAKAQPIEAPADLLNQKLLHEESFDTWSTWLRAHGVNAEFDLSGLRLFNGAFTLDAARYGRGIALTNPFVVNKDLKNGQLVEVKGSKVAFEHLTMGSYMLVAKVGRWNIRSIRRFREWLVAEIAKESFVQS